MKKISIQMNNPQKKIMILGASVDQVPMIKAAKDLGLYVVCCDFTNTNPGLPLVDKHYQVNYTDRAVLLEIARAESVIGVISNSDSAMENVAYLTEMLNLVGNNLSSIERLLDKSKFRTLLEEVGVFCPKHFLAKTRDELWDGIVQVKFPIIIKPCVCSASRGITVLYEKDEKKIAEAFNECLSFSWNKQVEVEEFVDMPGYSSIEGELFVYKDDVWFNGLFNVLRSKQYTLIPMTYSCPFQIDETSMNKIKDTVIKIVKGAGLEFGEFNIEMYFTKEGEPFIIELNARQGGRLLPIMVQEHNGIDYYKLLVSLAVSDESYYNYVKSRAFTPQRNCVSKHMVFAHKDGYLNGVVYAPAIMPFVRKTTRFIEDGSLVKNVKNGTHAIGMVELQFDNKEQQCSFLEQIEDNIYADIT